MKVFPLASTCNGLIDAMVVPLLRYLPCFFVAAGMRVFPCASPCDGLMDTMVVQRMGLLDFVTKGEPAVHKCCCIVLSMHFYYIELALNASFRDHAAAAAAAACA
jgi:hypothetical protein